jgi:hypothetical protein
LLPAADAFQASANGDARIDSGVLPPRGFVAAMRAALDLELLIRPRTTVSAEDIEGLF